MQAVKVVASVVFARGTALPADRELALYRLTTVLAAPRRRNARRLTVLGDQAQGFVRLRVGKHPKLRPAVDERYFAQGAGQLLVLDQAADTLLLEQILHVADFDQ